MRSPDASLGVFFLTGLFLQGPIVIDKADVCLLAPNHSNAPAVDLSLTPDWPMPATRPAGQDAVVPGNPPSDGGADEPFRLDR